MRKHEWEYTQSGKTSVKIHNAPGGNSQFSIGWQNDEPQQQYNKQVETYQSSYKQNAYDGYYGQVPSENMGFAGAPSTKLDHRHHTKGQVPAYESPSKYAGASDDRTSVKVHAPPGGKSNFVIGGGFNDQFQQPAFRQQDMNQGWDSGYKKPQPRNDMFKPSTDIFGSQGYSQQQAFGSKKQYQDDRFNQRQQQNDWDYSQPSYGHGSHNQFQQSKQQDVLFGQRVESGSNCGPTTEKSSVKLHAPPGGKSSIQFF